MKLGKKLIGGFMVVATVLLIVAVAVVLLGEYAVNAREKMVYEHKELEEVNDFYRRLYEDYALIIKYIISKDPTEASVILEEREKLYKQNYEIYEELKEELKEGFKEEDHEELKEEHHEKHNEEPNEEIQEKACKFAEEFEEVWNKVENINKVFESYVELRNQKAYNRSMFANISGNIADTRDKIKTNYFSNPEYKAALTERHPFQGKKTAASVIYKKMGNYEKEYLWQYKDQYHGNKLKATVDNLKDIILLTSLSQEAKNDLKELLNIYKNYIGDVGQYIAEDDIDRLTAQEAKYKHDIWNLKQKHIRQDWIDNPVYGDTFYIVRAYNINGNIENKSMDQLYYELEQHEKEVIFQDKGVITNHYNDLIRTIKEFNAYIDVTPLITTEKTAFKAVFDTFIGHIDDFINNREIMRTALDKFEQEKARYIATFDKILDDIMIGKSHDDEEGLDYIIAMNLAEVEEAEEDAKLAQNFATTVSIIGVVIAIIVSIVLGIKIAKSITKPVKEVTDATKKIIAGDLNISLKETGGDEITELSKAFNYMTINLKQEITRRERLEGDLKLTVDELARSNSELEQFAYVASHDLQEPLRKVTGFGSRLKEKYSDVISEQGQDYIDRMMNAASRMQDLIEGILVYSRITTMAKPFAPVNISTITQEVLSDFEILIEQTGAKVEFGDLPTIDADPLQMRQLFQNLIGNALKFHKKEDPPVVKIFNQLPDAQSQASSIGTCQINVEDNGIGFDENYTDRIFGIFQRLHGRSEYEGTGIGLSVCKKIVERHGGTIKAKSKLGEGTTFIITLPVKQS